MIGNGELSSGFAWADSCAAPIAGRTCKPRREGITMVIDKGLGRHATSDLLETGAPYVDLIKFGFGTSFLYPRSILRAKISLIRDAGVGVYPGGTFLEIAVAQGTWSRFLDRVVDLGFNWVEVSEGTIALDGELRSTLIKEAASRGLSVITEIGKKARGSRPIPDDVQERAALDLDAGAEFVIVEGRDSGTDVGVFDDHGVADQSLIEAILSGIPDPGRLVWEAPQVKQQQGFLLRYGPNVNLGNVQPEDLITLEATRQGLRGDTLREALTRMEASSAKTVRA